MAKKRKVQQGDVELNLTPLIDVIFLLIIFFILAGRITSELRAEKITVPPSYTAEETPVDNEWMRVIIELEGETQSNAGVTDPKNQIRFGGGPWHQIAGADDYEGYQHLRQELDRIHRHAPDYKEANGMQLKKVVVEIRADGDCEYRLVQEVMQVISDSIDPFRDMKPANHASPADAKPFVNIQFTTRKPDDQTE